MFSEGNEIFENCKTDNISDNLYAILRVAYIMFLCVTEL